MLPFLVITIISVMIMLAGLIVYWARRDVGHSGPNGKRHLREAWKAPDERRDEHDTAHKILFIVMCVTCALILFGALFIRVSMWRAFMNEPLTW